VIARDRNVIAVIGKARATAKTLLLPRVSSVPSVVNLD
jgi:hypothetical protein